jgi:hypothetical protein
MSAQPEALRLADDLYVSVRFYPQEGPDEPGGYESEFDMVLDQAAAELRRLHEVNAELVESLREVRRDVRHMLKGHFVQLKDVEKELSAAIAKATGEQQ